MEKRPKAASHTDLNPELEIKIDTKAYNEIKVIIENGVRRTGKIQVLSRVSLGWKSTFLFNVIQAIFR